MELLLLLLESAQIRGEPLTPPGRISARDDVLAQVLKSAVIVSPTVCFLQIKMESSCFILLIQMMDFWFTVAVFVSSLRGAERRPSPWKQRSGSADVVWLQSEITRSHDTPEVTHRSLRRLLSCRKTARSEPEVRRTLFFKQPRHDS